MRRDLRRCVPEGGGGPEGDGGVEARAGPCEILRASPEDRP
jgi:hypothetical protein